MHRETGCKLCKVFENLGRDTPLRDVYIPHFDEIPVKNSVLGVLYPNRCTGGGEIWHGGAPPCQISPPSVHRGEKPQNRPLSNLNTGALRFANAAGNNDIHLSLDVNTWFLTLDNT